MCAALGGRPSWHAALGAAPTDRPVSPVATAVPENKSAVTALFCVAPRDAPEQGNHVHAVSRPVSSIDIGSYS
jgi:hypothetical protein